MSSYSNELLEKYKNVSTATITTVLLKLGVRNAWLRGAFPLASDQKRIAGPAFTLRFIPAREDVATPASWSSPKSTRAAIETMPEGCIVVIDANGNANAGVFGDILCQRMQQRNVAGMITDGVVRDLEGVLETGLGVWAAGTSAPASIAGLTFVNWQDPIGCGGIAVFPHDLIVADNDGAVVVPAKMVEEVLPLAIEQEELEEWILSEVRAGATLTGLYPVSEENRKRFDAWRKK